MKCGLPLCAFLALHLLVVFAGTLETGHVKLPLHRRQQAPTVLRVRGNFTRLFEYYTTVLVGTPPVPFTVTLDTGSSDFLISSVNCSACIGGNHAKYYNVSRSRTGSIIGCARAKQLGLKCTSCASNKCKFNLDYSGGADVDVHAVAVKDVVRVASLETPLDFGVIVKVSMPSLAQRAHVGANYSYYPEGIVGLAYKNASALGALPFFSSLVAYNRALRDVFSMCFTESNGGVLVLGGLDRNLYKGTVQYTPIVLQEDYNVHVADFLVNGVSIKAPVNSFKDKVSIVDTGTPGVYLPSAAFQALKKLLFSNCSNSNLYGICRGVRNSSSTLLDGVCFKMSQEQRKQFPTFFFKLGEHSGAINVPYPPESYLRYTYNCLNADEVGLWLFEDKEFAVLGAKMLQGYYTIFDRANGRLGFAPVATCKM